MVSGEDGFRGRKGFCFGDCFIWFSDFKKEKKYDIYLIVEGDWRCFSLPCSPVHCCHPFQLKLDDAVSPLVGAHARTKELDLAWMTQMLASTR